jgi:alkylated DNA repair protein (DNA oxidative demethylase)
MPKSGKPLSVAMTNAGPLGWVTDKDGGYRYQAHHPETGRPWPAIPDGVMAIWREVSGCPAPPEACLVNLYGETARMGQHVDRDEEDRSAPVVSISLGDTALFRLGGLTRKDPTRSVKLASGAVVVLGGESRMAHHGVDRIYPGSSTLLENFPVPGVRRVNLTLRRVSRI